MSNVRRDFKRAISSMTTFSRAPWVATTGWETAGYFVDLATGYTQAHSALSSLKQIGREPTISELNEDQEVHSLSERLAALRKSLMEE